MQHLRVAEQGGGEPEPLPHAEGEPARPGARRRGQVDLVQHLVDPAAGRPRGRGQDAQVVAGPSARVEAGRLEQRADPAARLVQAGW